MFQLNYRDSRPIYEQLKEQLRRLIVTGALKSDEKLPSIREVATSLAINPNTIQRAYRELENEGYVYTIAGKGSFAAPRQDIDARRDTELLERFDTTVTELYYLNYTADSLYARMINLMKKTEKGESKL